jgi:hypothetical protein
MKRTFCDGCYRAGRMNDITDEPPSNRWRVQVTKAQILDLCMDCAPKFQRLDLDKQRLVNQHSEEFKIKLKDLMDRFWQEVTEGAQERAREE